MQQTKLKAPFAWVGGKSLLAKHIIPLMPPHERYVEVFGGALSVFYLSFSSARVAKQKKSHQKLRSLMI